MTYVTVNNNNNKYYVPIILLNYKYIYMYVCTIYTFFLILIESSFTDSPTKSSIVNRI